MSGGGVALFFKERADGGGGCCVYGFGNSSTVIGEGSVKMSNKKIV